MLSYGCQVIAIKPHCMASLSSTWKAVLISCSASLLCNAKHTRDIFQLSWKPYSQEPCSWDTSFLNGKINIDYTFHLCLTPSMPNIEVKNFLAACLHLLSVYWMELMSQGQLMYMEQGWSAIFSNIFIYVFVYLLLELLFFWAINSSVKKDNLLWFSRIKNRKQLFLVLYL